LYQQAVGSGTFFISLHSLQETAFVLTKLKVPSFDVETIIKDWLKLRPVAYDATHFRRAVDLASQIGFQHISDCLHTAIAERTAPNCTRIINLILNVFSLPLLYVSIFYNYSFAYFPVISNSVRRFCWRPSSVSLLATGRSAP
jgi:hypothetical protein